LRLLELEWLDDAERALTEVQPKAVDGRGPPL
jgi:hypothetical protein